MPDGFEFMGSTEWNWRELKGPVLQDLATLEREMQRLREKADALLAKAWAGADPLTWEQVKALNDEKQQQLTELETKIRAEASAEFGQKRDA
ncbi:MAG: hypothetical protein KGR26_16860 [Cyanobacteria bacterium REEB65]|nr:hypothetical protein [Cyanobacteria bacterium REEB65]